MPGYVGAGPKFERGRRELSGPFHVPAHGLELSIRYAGDGMSL
jgi:hypothetical protein